MNMCKQCLWREVCDQNYGCDNFTPVNEDGFLETFIEDKRSEFFEEWVAYTNTDDE